MIKKLFTVTLLLALFGLNIINAQTVEELKAQRAEKQSQIAALQGEVGGLTSQIEQFPGWKFGSLGTLGMNFSNFSDWLPRATPNTFSSVVGFSGNASANLDQEKYFWRNSGNLNMAWTKLNLDTKNTGNDSLKYEATSDAINVSSLFGYKLNKHLAASAMGEYRSTIISNFNNPGYLDLGVGATWTPMSNLVVVFHPLNYNIVMADENFDYVSSLGCKIMADYAQSLPKGISWRSNLSAFVSYKDVANYSNWTWVNGFGLNVWKGIGVGFELGLRGNKQEGYNAALPDQPTLKIQDLPSADNPLQSYWLLGLTYSL